MKKFLFMALSLVFLFACKNPQNDGGTPSNKTEEFKVNFNVKDGTGGTLTAKIKNGDAITTGKKVAKDKEVVFTATPKDSTWSVESWTLNGNPIEEAKLKNEKKEFTLPITEEVTVIVKFKKEGSNPPPNPDEFKVNFSVKDKEGGTLTARIKDGNAITTGGKVAKDKEVVFTATPKDSTYIVESWTLNGSPVEEAKLKNEKKEFTLAITGEVTVIVKFKKEGSNPPPNPSEFNVNFSVKDGVGGTLTARIKDGNAITTGGKVAKDKEVVFTATPTDSTWSVEGWTLNGNPIEEAKLKNEKKEFTLPITEEVTVVVKFKTSGGGTPNLKDINIDFITLGYPNISPRDGKKVMGEELNENKVLEDFEVPDAKFPIQVHHKSEFTVEQAFVTFDGGTKEELTNPIGKTILAKDYTLVQDKKTPVIIDITGEGYKPLKLTFNVTYKKPEKKYVDDITNISIIRNKSGSLTNMYGAIGKPLTELKGGTTTIDVSREDPIMTISVRKGDGGQAKAEIKLDGTVMENTDFATGSGMLEVHFNSLSRAKHHIEIKLEKPGYETANYDFYIHYKPLLSFKSLVINGTTYNQMAQIKQIKLEAIDPNPVTISGEVNEAGATISFKKLENGNWVVFTPPLDLQEGKNLSLRMYASLEGYATTYFSFRLQRKIQVTPIVFNKIEVDGTEVAKGGTIEVSKLDAKVNLVVTLKQKYEDINFTINDDPGLVEFDSTGTIATFADFAVTKDGSLPVKIHASCPPNYTDCEETITITHKTPAKEKITITKIEVDGKEVQNDAIEVEKADAKVKLMVFLKQKYENISFKLNDVSLTPDLGEYGMIATFNDFAITKDGSLQVKINASSANFESCEKTITITHKTPQQQEAGGYITAVAVTPWDSEDGGHRYPVNFSKTGDTWSGDTLSDGGPHRFTIEIDTKDKDITDVTKFTLYMKDANSSTVYFDKITGSKKGEKLIVFERSKDTIGRDINLPTGTTTLDVKLYYGEEVVETCKFIVKQ